MSRIVAAFDLQPPIYLVKEFDNSVLFPGEGSGKFNPASLISGRTYEVQGSGQDHSGSTLPIPQHSTSPFGSYSQVSSYPPPQPKINIPPPHPPLTAPKFPKRAVCIKKTIPVANLSLRDSTKASTSSSKTNGMIYTIVTQVIVSINSSLGECNVTSVSEMVKAQLGGLEVILLDSKLYPIMDNEATSGVEFWKSTRKIIAASRSLYEKLVPDAELDQGEDTVITEPLSKKRKIESEAIQLEDIAKKLDAIDSKLSFIDEIKKTFECLVCRSAMKLPVVAPCCEKIIGCDKCIQRWLRSNSRCPHCSVSGRMNERIILKGMEDILGFIRIGDGPRFSPPPISIDSDDSSDDFHPLPRFRSAPPAPPS